MNENRISVTENGPYLVEGSLPLSEETIGVNAESESVKWEQGKTLISLKRYSLCRCGRSSAKPLCDGSHVKAKFDGTETAIREPVMVQAKIFAGPEMNLADAPRLCANARFCDPNGKVWNQVAKTEIDAIKVNFVRQVGECPSGRLLAIDKATERSIEPAFDQSIATVEDPSLNCSGPLSVRGGVQVVASDGYEYEIRNRVTLCRCGRSDNKPFCTGAHAIEPKFKAEET